MAVAALIAGSAPSVRQIVKADVAVLWPRIFPGNHEYDEALLREELDQRIRRRQVEDVVFHDPRRHDHDRLRAHAFGRRGGRQELGGGLMSIGKSRAKIYVPKRL